MINDDVLNRFDVTDRVVIVTGGTRGIGRALAEGFAACGAKVVVASRKADACAETAAALVGTGAAAIGVPTQLSSVDDISRLVDRTVAEFGGVDIVINNAANALTQPLGDITVEALRKSHSVNLEAPIFLAQAALPYLKQSAHASIVNVLSVGALMYSPGTAMYSGAKAAMLAYTRNMAAEWAPYGIRVNALAPGSVDTDMTRNTGAESMARMADASLQKRIATPTEMFGPVLFLASEAASFVTGQMLIADGGLAIAR